MVLALLAVAGCGGGPRQDASEPSGTFHVEVTRASFPRVQHIAQPVALRLRVRNADRGAIANIAVTVQTQARDGDAAVAFGQNDRGQELASAARPIWILDKGPKGADTVDVDTWTSGPLRGGESRLMTWRLVAVKAGTYTIRYRVAPGLTGKGRAASGRTSGSFRVRITDEPVPARVGPDGTVIRGH